MSQSIKSARKVMRNLFQERDLVAPTSEIQERSCNR